MSCRIICFTILIISVFGNLYAQEKKKKKQDPAEIRFSYGFYTQSYTQQDIDFPSYSKHSFGVLGSSYLKKQGKSGTKLGMNISYQHITIDGGYSYTQSQTHLCFFPEVQVKYYQQKMTEMYFDLCYGIETNVKATDQVNTFPSKGVIKFSDVYQVSPICLFIDGKTPFFLEIGYGCKGIINCGFVIKI